MKLSDKTPSKYFIFLIPDKDFCLMQKELEEIKAEVTARIYKEFMAKFGGNKLQFAKAVGCDEKALRLLFDEGSGMTLNLLFKLCGALELQPSEVLKGLSIKNNL